MVNHKPASNRIPSIAGKRFGRLVALNEVEKNRHGARRWLCQCDCGTPPKVVLQDLLRSGMTRSCGCLHREVSRGAIKHGHARKNAHSPELIAWRNMLHRCYRERTHNYAAYGGRGITVCERWRGRGGFQRFLADFGLRPTRAHSLDRYPDTNGNYEPGNVRWATLREQAQNKRDTLLVAVNGRSVPLIALTRSLGVSYWRTYSRLRRGQSLHGALGFDADTRLPDVEAGV